MEANTVKIRQECSDDGEAIRAVNVAAFGRPQESVIVDALRTNGAIALSLVGVLGKRIVSHVLYSAVSIDRVAGAGLGPMAVLPEFQRKGIGSELIRSGNDILRQRGCPFIVVLGHPEYYPRFGFRPASAHGVHCQWAVPENAFMILFLHRPKMLGVSGVAKYRDEFSEVL